MTLYHFLTLEKRKNWKKIKINEKIKEIKMKNRKNSKNGWNGSNIK